MRMDITLSVLVISHNQAHLIGRCLDSILSQQLNVPYEIVISDDASTDNTWDVILSYQKRYPNIIRSFQINSSDYNPDITSDRCAINKANVYKQARGKYVVNIDADDYLCDDDIYQKQLNLLETNKECWACMQNIVIQDDGDNENFSSLWFPSATLLTGKTINCVQYYKERLLISNPALMMKRDINIDPIKQYGLLFDDFVITMHHISQGDIVCLDKASYVYVQYKNSIWKTVINSSFLSVRSIAALNILILYFPNYSREILLHNLYSYIHYLKKILSNNVLITVDRGNRKYIERLNSKFLLKLINFKNIRIQNFVVRTYLLFFLLVSKFKTNLGISFLLKVIK